MRGDWTGYGYVLILVASSLRASCEGQPGEFVFRSNDKHFSLLNSRVRYLVRLRAIFQIADHEPMETERSASALQVSCDEPSNAQNLVSTKVFVSTFAFTHATASATPMSFPAINEPSWMLF
uniref:Putative secreted protein n=1 Tax=Anopheles darlingi TaxID=43151 RepID=A0A2M4DJR0_ANODA